MQQRQIIKLEYPYPLVLQFHINRVLDFSSNAPTRVEKTKTSVFDFRPYGEGHTLSFPAFYTPVLYSSRLHGLLLLNNFKTKNAIENIPRRNVPPACAYKQTKFQLQNFLMKGSSAKFQFVMCTPLQQPFFFHSCIIYLAGQPDLPKASDQVKERDLVGCPDWSVPTSLSTVLISQHYNSVKV